MQGKINILSKPVACISYRDIFSFKWLHCNCTDYQTGSCDNTIVVTAKLGEPEYRGLQSFSYKIERKNKESDWIKIKEETIPINENGEFFIFNSEVAVQGEEGLNTYRLSTKTNIDSEYKIYTETLQCRKVGAVQIIPSLIIMNNNSSEYIIRDNSPVNIKTEIRPLGDLAPILKNIHYILERKDNGNWVTVKEKNSTSFVDIYSEQDLHSIGVETSYRSRISVEYLYSHIPTTILTTNIVIVRKIEKPSITALAGIKQLPEITNPQTSLQPTKDHSFSLVIGGIGEKDLKNISNIKITLQKQKADNVYIDEKPISNINVGENYFSNNIDTGISFSQIENYQTTTYRYKLNIQYKFSHLTPDEIFSNDFVHVINKSIEGADPECEKELQHGQMVNNNYKIFRNRNVIINGVKVRTEPNLQGQNYIPKVLDPQFCQSVFIPRFDQMLVYFLYDSTDGADIDIAVGIENSSESSLNNAYVGCGQQETINHIGKYNIFYKNPDNIFLKSLGDDNNNQKDGLQGEAVVMEFNKLYNNGFTGDVELAIWTGWHQNRPHLTGEFTLVLECYLGGTMERIPNTQRYQNVGGQKVEEVRKNFRTNYSPCATKPLSRADDTTGRKKYTGSVFYDSRTKEARLVMRQ